MDPSLMAQFLEFAATGFGGTCFGSSFWGGREGNTCLLFLTVVVSIRPNILRERCVQCALAESLIRQQGDAIMKFVGISAMGFLGGLVFSSLGWLSQETTKSSPPGGRNQVSVQKPVLNTSFETDGIDSPSMDQAQVVSLDAERNLRRKVELLELGQKFLQSAPDYTTTLTKREVVKGDLLDPQTISMKCRVKPFSVYLLWLEGDVGREVIYVDGQNDGKLIAHDGGWKARIPAFSLAVDCMLAMRDSRYPVTMAGLGGLTEMMLEIHQKDLAEATYASCEFNEDQSIEGRSCYLVTTKYQSPEDSPCYRKSLTWIDKEWNVPVQSHHYEWPNSETANLNEHDLDEATLIESYSFAKLQFGSGLTDHDFDRSNDEYGFR